ncbi:MAG: iron-sulfur cluster assembly scaffold protein [Terriglobales bacterium]
MAKAIASHGTVKTPSMYSAQVLDHFQNPRNPGEVGNPHCSVQLENPACGDVLKLSLKIAEGRIQEIRFLAQGCVPTIACASLLTELVQGKTIAEARQLRREELVNAIGGLPEASLHASHLAMDALQAVIKNL